MQGWEKRSSLARVWLGLVNKSACVARALELLSSWQALGVNKRSSLYSISLWHNGYVCFKVYSVKTAYGYTSYIIKLSPNSLRFCLITGYHSQVLHLRVMSQVTSPEAQSSWLTLWNWLQSLVGGLEYIDSVRIKLDTLPGAWNYQ